jgi:hypothetical protein
MTNILDKFEKLKKIKILIKGYKYQIYVNLSFLTKIGKITEFFHQKSQNLQNLPKFYSFYWNLPICQFLPKFTAINSKNHLLFTIIFSAFKNHCWFYAFLLRETVKLWTLN